MCSVCSTVVCSARVCAKQCVYIIKCVQLFGGGGGGKIDFMSFHFIFYSESAVVNTVGVPLVAVLYTVT